MIAKQTTPTSASAGSTDTVSLPAAAEETYEAVLRALAGHRLKPKRDHGRLELPARIESLSWQAYKDFLAAWGDQHVRHIYDQGLLEIMSPLKSHDWIKRLISRFIETLALDQNIAIQSIGSTTITSDECEKGFEADEAYYIANEPKVRGKLEFEPDVDPPPDLIIEVDVTHSSKSRLPLFAAMKVPEIWCHDAQQLVFMVRTRQGRYRVVTRSKAFPFLEPDDIVRFLDLYGSMTENDLVRRFVRWARRRRKEFETK
jgi:Uma2 family endonuclease